MRWVLFFDFEEDHVSYFALYPCADPKDQRHQQRQLYRDEVQYNGVNTQTHGVEVASIETASECAMESSVSTTIDYDWCVTADGIFERTVGTGHHGANGIDCFL